MDREDFFAKIPTLDDGVELGLSWSDNFDGAALIQVGPQEDGDYTCVYLNEDQLVVLRDRIEDYLALV